jgi:pimeloyl-ACP methyl ester carboxylesterase
MGDSLRFITALTSKFKAEFVAFDFTGYGESRVASVGEEVICGDLEMVLAWLCRPLDEVMLWGFSLGTYPVTMAAAKLPLKATILQCPIGSLSCMFYDEYERDIKFKEDHFANIDHIAAVSGRVLLLHSMADEIIPVEQARLLYNKYVAANGDKMIEFIEVEKIKHNAFHKYIVSLNSNELQKEVVTFLAVNRQEIEVLRADSEG